jgi:hypothetical protein
MGCPAALLHDFGFLSCHPNNLCEPAGMYDSIKPVLLVGPLEGNFLASFGLGWAITILAGVLLHNAERGTARGRRKCLPPGCSYSPCSHPQALPPTPLTLCVGA